MLNKIINGLDDCELELFVKNKIEYLIELSENSANKKQISKELKILDNAFDRLTLKDLKVN